MDEAQPRKARWVWTLIRVIVLLAIAGVIGRHLYVRRLAGKHAEEGVRLAKAGKLEEAIVEFEKALKTRPGFATARSQLAEVCRELAEDHSARNEFPEAERYCKRAIELGYHSEDVYWRLSEALWRQAKYDEALAALAKHVERNPDDHRPEAMRRAILRDQKRGGE